MNAYAAVMHAALDERIEKMGKVLCTREKVDETSHVKMPRQVCTRCFLLARRAGLCASLHYATQRLSIS
jgi:hypothetical protein